MRTSVSVNLLVLRLASLGQLLPNTQDPLYELALSAAPSSTTVCDGSLANRSHLSGELELLLLADERLEDLLLAHV